MDPIVKALVAATAAALLLPEAVALIERVRNWGDGVAALKTSQAAEVKTTWGIDYTWQRPSPTPDVSNP